VSLVAAERHELMPRGYQVARHRTPHRAEPNKSDCVQERRPPRRRGTEDCEPGWL